MPRNKNELALEIHQLKQQLRERERESRIMKRLVLTVNTYPNCFDNFLHHESK